MSDEKILIVLPVLNLWDRYTRACIDSVFANVTSPPFHILLIDNASTDGTTEKALAFKPREMMTVITNSENKGCGGGWNQGINWGIENGYTHFLILNNDTLVGPRTIQGMYERMKQADVMLVSAVDVTGELPQPERILEIEHPVNRKSASEAPHPHFSCFMIDRNTVEKVGMFDEAFFPAYFEDNDFHYRIKLAGGMGVATTTAVFYHFGSRTQNEATGKPIVPGSKFEENRAYFVKKWGGVPTAETFLKPFNDQSKDIKHVTRK